MTGWRQPRRLVDFGELTPGETKVLVERDSGQTSILGDGALPPRDAPPDRQVRASFLRWLALGGDADHGPHETGVRIIGGLIVSDGPEGAETRGLDLEGCTVERDIGCIACRFEDAPVLRSARLAGLFLNREHLPGIPADRLETRGGVFLRSATVEGEMRLLGARIGGALDCAGAKLRNADRAALAADGCSVTGHVFLKDAETDGGVRLLGARIGGDLVCEGARLRNAGGEALNADRCSVPGSFFLRRAEADGEVRLVGARIGGNLDCEAATLRNMKGKVLNAEGAHVAGAFVLRKGAEIAGCLDLTGAKLGRVIDDRACWPAEGNLVLDRCRYGAFTGQGVSADERVGWLARQTPMRFEQDFWPQPYEQCAKVLREMGHLEAAKAVLIKKEKLQREARRLTLRLQIEAAWWRAWLDLARPGERFEEILNRANERLKRLGSSENGWQGTYEAGELARQIGRTTSVVAIKGDPRGPTSERNMLEPTGDVPVESGTVLGDRRLRAAAEIGCAALRLVEARVRDFLFSWIIAYGHRPMRAAWYAVGIWLFGAVFFAHVEGQGAMMPNNAFVLRAPEWTRCAAPPGETVTLSAPGTDGEGIRAPSLRAPGETRLDCFRRQPEAADFPRFQPLAYSADTLVPVVELHQEAHWIPNPNLSTGCWGRLYLWLQISIGWALSLLAIAGFTGLVKSE